MQINKWTLILFCQTTKLLHYLFNKLVENASISSLVDHNFYREFLIKTHLDVSIVNKHLNKNGILSLKVINQTDNLLQVAVTENRTKEELDFLIKVMEGLNE